MDFYNYKCFEPRAYIMEVFNGTNQALGPLVITIIRALGPSVFDTTIKISAIKKQPKRKQSLASMVETWDRHLFGLKY
jgi:hypothetical protein